MFNIVLHEPEMPANTGNIGRTWVATGSSLHLIKPLGFQINDKMLKRAGLDYWEHLDVHYYADYDDVALCWLFGKMLNLPRGFPMYTKDLKQMYDEKEIYYLNDNPSSTGISQHIKVMGIKSLSNYPTQENEHNSLADAKWNKELYEFLKQI